MEQGTKNSYIPTRSDPSKFDNVVLNGGEVGEPSGHGGDWRGHSVKTYMSSYSF